METKLIHGNSFKLPIFGGRTKLQKSGQPHTNQLQYVPREGDHLNIFRATALDAVAEAKGAWTKY